MGCDSQKHGNITIFTDLNSQINHIFDPFYSTKYQNSGLGLSIALKCISENNGHISCHSEAGKGTAFTLHFPVNNILQKTKKKASSSVLS